MLGTQNVVSIWWLLLSMKTAHPIAELQPKACWVPAASLLLKMEGPSGGPPLGTRMFEVWILEKLL